jgi:Ca-activated chloride channel homolog
MLKKIRCFAVFALLFCTLFSSDSKGQEKTDDEVIKVDTNLVTVPVIVSDRQNRYIAGLKAENFTVLRDGQKQQIDYFASEEAPINVAILLDTSRSTERVLDKIQSAALEFIKQLTPNDRCLIVSFDWRVNVLSELTGDREKLKKAIKNAAIGERFGTVLQDAVFRAVDRNFAGVKGRKAVILLTDGKDFGSAVSRDELIYRLEESDTLVYSIFYETGFMPQRMTDRPQFPFPNRRGGGGIWRRRRNPDVMRRRNEESNENAIDFLREMAEVSAGRFYQKEIRDLSKTFEAIAEELRKQYLIGFYPENIETGRVYQLKVKVDRNETVVRAKSVFRVKGN